MIKGQNDYADLFDGGTGRGGGPGAVSLSVIKLLVFNAQILFSQGDTKDGEKGKGGEARGGGRFKGCVLFITSVDSALVRCMP